MRQGSRKQMQAAAAEAAKAAGGRGKGRAITGNITGSTDGLLYDAWFWESCTGTWSMSVWVRDRRGAARALFSLAS